MSPKHPRLFLILTIALLYICFDIIAGSWYLRSTKKQPFYDQLRKQRETKNRAPHPVYSQSFIPNTQAVFTWGVNTYLIYINSLGLIDKEIRTVPLITNKHRILFIGDSFVEGVAYPYQKTFVGQIDQKLPDTDFDVLNTGYMGTSPKIYYLKTKYLLETVGLHIDEAIIFIDVSDIHNEVYYYEHFEPDYTAQPVLEERPIKITKQKAIIGYLVDNSLLFNTLYTAAANKETNITAQQYKYEDVVENWTFDPQLMDIFGNKGLTLAAENMNKLIRTLRKHNIHSITIVVYPWPEQIRHKDRDSVHVHFWSDFAKKQNIQFINLFPVFFDQIKPIEKLYYMDGEHWNDKGHALVANSLFNTLGLATRSGDPQQPQ